MCGRFTHLMTWREIHRLYSIHNVPATDPPKRYNVAPTQSVPVIRQDDNGIRFVSDLRWGLVPEWSSEPTTKYATFNARIEDAATKPAFRNAVAKAQRCLIPVSGFYEWQKLPGDKKQPWYITPKADGGFAFAGLWERWEREGSQVESFTILTTTPNSFMEKLHNRMPCILQPEHFGDWLGSGGKGIEIASQLLPADEMQAWKVGTRVGNSRVEASDLIHPAETSSD